MRFSAQSVALEHAFARCLDAQMRHGFYFDVEKAEALYRELSIKRAGLDDELAGHLPQEFVDIDFTPKKKLRREKRTPFNTNSRFHIARLFREKYGWEPKVYNDDGSAKVDEKILNSLPFPEAKALAQRVYVNKLCGLIAEGSDRNPDDYWLNFVDEDSRIRGYINHNGAYTGRCTHSRPNLANVHSERRPYGRECRELFRVPEGYKLVGYDLSGLELRCLAHYLYLYDNGAYADIILNGDIHSANQEAAGLETREQSKRFIYAFNYGAGDSLLGAIVGGGAKDGKELRRRFLAGIPGFKALQRDLKQSAKRGYLKALDGRWVKVYHQHAALNTLLQSAGGICMKQATVAVNDSPPWISEQQVAHVHDEAQVEVLEKDAEEFAAWIPGQIKAAGETLSFRMPLEGEAKIGNNWAETH